jgi:hypothetical protein
MDDLDRLFRRLVHNVQGGFPHLLSRQFQLSDIAQHLVPYRHNRRELGLETNQDYEHALMRLVSGERGYVLSDLTVQEATRRELASADPDPELLRTYGSSLVSLAPDALARAEALGPAPTAAPMAEPTRSTGGDEGTRARSGSDSPATSTAAATGGSSTPARPAEATSPAAPAAPRTPTPTPTAAATHAEPAIAAQDRSSRSATPVTPDPMPWTDRVVILTPDGPRSGTGASSQQQGAASVTSPNQPNAASAGAGQSPTPPRPSSTSPSAFAEPADGYVTPSGRPTPAIAGGGSCRYCGGSLPDGRQVTFCPHCGQNVTIVQCPACSTELELGWKFCITCGRSADTAGSGARSQ